MVPSPEPVYFPSLDKCLNGGDQLLISWEAAFYAILDSKAPHTGAQTGIDSFFSDGTVKDLLSRPFTAFPKATPQSKTAYETRASPINATIPADSPYSIAQVKADTEWLSKEAKIDEVTALRIVVLECQSRASALLKGRLSNEELSGLQGSGPNQTVVPLALLSQGIDADVLQAEFETPENRQLRILRLYLSERQYILKCVDYLIQTAAYAPPAAPSQGKGSQEPLSPMEQMGQSLFQGLIGSDEWLLNSFQAIARNINNVDDGSAWFGGREDIDSEWIDSQLVEVTHTLEIVFQALDKSECIASSTVILAWHDLVKSYKYLQFNGEGERTAKLAMNMQSMVAIVSFQILSVGRCLDWLQNTDSATGESDDDNAAFILKMGTIERLHAVMLDIVDLEIPTSGPAMLSWAVIMQTIRMRVVESNPPPYEEEDGSVSQTVTKHDIYTDILGKIQDNAGQQLDNLDAIAFLASRAVDTLHAYEILSDLALHLGSGRQISTVIGARARIVILDLLQSSVIGIGYGEQAISVAISALTGGQGYWDALEDEQHPNPQDPCEVFLGSDSLVSTLLYAARSRYPFETLPFLKLVRALALGTQFRHKHVIEFLQEIPSFTYALPQGFTDYQTTQEQEDNNTIQLTSSVQLFETTRSTLILINNSTALSRIDESLVIPPGTLGRMILEDTKEDKQTLRVAVWFHRYSGLEYLGTLLETFLTASDKIDITTGRPADHETVVEIIALFALLIRGSSTANGVNVTNEDAMEILRSASHGLHRTRDITTVIFDIFDEELQRQANSLGSGGPLELLSSCVQFVHALLPVMPGRVWPFIGKSGLLELGRGSGKLSTIVGSIELVTGQYQFLLSCTWLYKALVKDLVVNGVSRKCAPSSSTRFDSTDGEGHTIGTGVPDEVLSNILLSFTRFFVDVLESSCNWKFLDKKDCRQLRKNTTCVFGTILHCVYGIERNSANLNKPVSDQLPSTKLTDLTSVVPNTKSHVSKAFVSKTVALGSSSPKSTIKLFAVCESAASHIVDSYLSATSGNLRIQPILATIYDGLEATNSSSHPHESRPCIEQVECVLSFSRALLRISALVDRPPSQLEAQLFKCSPLLARLYCVHDSYTVAVIALFEALVVSASVNSTEPPSLLGHLGPRVSQSFLDVISNLDKPLSRGKNTTAIMHFLSKVTSCRQQWFANYLLSGRLSRNTTNGKETFTLSKSTLNASLEAFSTMDQMPKVEVVERLEFIALAQNFWPWATYDSQKHAEFIKNISEHMGRMRPLQPSPTTEAILDSCYQTKTAALISEILAMNLFHSRQTGAPSAAKDLTPNLDYFTRFAVSMPSYNSSLHANLKRNFETRYPGLNLLDFQGTNMDNRQFGEEYFYDVLLMDKMLSFDPAWNRRTGFSTEVINANLNLSLVDAQISLLNGWKYLALELSIDLSNQKELQQRLARVAVECLLSNKKSQGSEEVFQRLNQTRADLALILVQRLVEVKSSVPEMPEFILKIWETIRQSNLTYEIVLSSGDPSYYRSMLKLLFLGIRVHSDNVFENRGGKVDPKASTRALQNASIMAGSGGHKSTIIGAVTEILDRVVAKGLRDIVTFLHDQPENSAPQDIALITGILQACLRVPGIELFYSQVVTIFVQNDSARVASTLFSWSDTLAVDGDPIYGELSVLFLLELSSVPAMAEQLAVEGVLGHIGSANITTYLRRNNVSPFADGAGIQRCYSIWVRGILPFLLNLLDAVGSSIAAEVCVFLNQFPNLLRQSVTALEPPPVSRVVKTQSTPKHITLSMCTEAHTLSLLLFVLNGLREGGLDIPEVKWDSASMLDNAQELLGASSQLAGRIIPMGEFEIAMFRKNQLEERVKQELKGIRNVLTASYVAED